MKKLFSLISLLLAILVATSSCDPKDPVIEKGALQSATYDSATKSFTLTYAGGQTETIKATIDDSVTPPTALAVLSDGTVIYFADASKSGAATITKKVNIVSQFVYDGMSSYYLWADEVTSKKPKATDINPEKYFYSILNATDTEHGWSWITDDVDDLLKGFQGESTDAFGFQPLPLYADASRTTIIGFIRYVYPDTPADNAGLKRGDVIIKINGQTINIKNFMGLYGANSETTFTVLDQKFENPREVKVMPAKQLNTDPVLYSNVYEIEGKKIGYLFYTGFIEKYNNSLYEAFSKFKTAGVTDLVLDLRYNPGGGISAATYLASLIAPQENVSNKAPFTIMSYNQYINKVYDDKKWDRKSYLGNYDPEFQNPLNANLNLNKLYVIATGSSASASELLTFCLKPYMQVEHIGEKTSGKYTASWTLHPYDNFGGGVQPVYKESSLSSTEKNKLKNWAMQPIVGRYTDKNNKDFMATNGLIPNHAIKSQEYNTETWKPIGDVNDYLFAKAISLITGKPYEAALRSSDVKQFKETGLYPQIESITRQAVIIDNPKLLPPLK